MDIVQNLEDLRSSIPGDVALVAVSKTKPVSMVRELYDAGHRDFGENKVQDLTEKQQQLPADIRWHMIGHLQTNKVKYIAPFVHLVHGVDSLKLLKVLDKEGRKNNRVIDCLLQVHIAREESKFGLSEAGLKEILSSPDIGELEYVKIKGLMGMATFTDDSDLVRKEFQNLKRIFETVKADHFSDDQAFSILSMGMSADYALAIEEGSTMVRIGSSIFGLRNYP